MANITKPFEAPHSADRIDWINFAKGVAILLVVIGHAWRGLEASGLIAQPLFSAVDSRIYAFHMPVFFALSGLFFIPSLARLSPGEFLKKRLTRLVWPLLIWTYLFLGAKVLAGQFANTPIGIDGLLVLPFPGILHLWFLWALLLQSLAFATLRPLLVGAKIPSLLLWLISAALVGTYLIEIPPDAGYWIGNAVKYAPFFFLGIVLEQTGALSRITRPAQTAAVVIFAALIALWPLIGLSSLRPLGSLIATLCFLMACTAVHSAAQSTPARLFTALGAASMAIYLAHTICSAGMREMLLFSNIDTLWLQMLLGVGVGILGPLMLDQVARKKRFHKLLGF